MSKIYVRSQGDDSKKGVTHQGNSHALTRIYGGPKSNSVALLTVSTTWDKELELYRVETLFNGDHKAPAWSWFYKDGRPIRKDDICQNCDWPKGACKC